MRRPLFAVGFGIALAVSGAAQTPTAPQVPAAASAQPAEFEVASVKRNQSGTTIVRVQTGASQFQATNVTAALLLTQAFRVQNSQFVGTPSWAESERYDVIARVPEGVTPTPAAQQEMLRALLEERFGLVTHRETRELPISALVVARADGRLGPDLVKSANDCTPGARRGGPPPAGPPPAPPAFGRGARPRCGTMSGPGLVSSGGITMARLAEMLSAAMGRIVVDRTDLPGFYDLDLLYTPDQLPQAPPPPGVQLPTFDPNGPPLQTAIREQLGLALESTRGPVEVVVIDRFERPTED